MKHIIPAFASLLVVGILLVGCGPNPKAGLEEDGATRLSADDLALLQDFHAWKLPIPQSQQPVARVKLVLLGSDATSVQLFGTAFSKSIPAWTNILLGFHYQSGRFAGRLHLRGATRLGETYSLNFTNASTDYARSWAGSARWDGNRAELATFWVSEEAAKSGGNGYSTLAVELVK